MSNVLAEREREYRMASYAVLRQFLDEIAVYALFRWNHIEILHALVRDHGIDRNKITAEYVKSYMETEEFIQKKDVHFSECVIAVQRFKEASEVAIDTSKERIELAGMQKRRIQGLFKEELRDGRMNKQLRSEIKMLSDILSAEDKKKENVKDGDPFRGLFDNASSKATVEQAEEA